MVKRRKPGPSGRGEYILVDEDDRGKRSKEGYTKFQIWKVIYENRDEDFVHLDGIRKEVEVDDRTLFDHLKVLTEEEGIVERIKKRSGKYKLPDKRNEKYWLSVCISLDLTRERIDNIFHFFFCRCGKETPKGCTGALINNDKLEEGLRKAIFFYDDNRIFLRRKENDNLEARMESAVSYVDKINYEIKERYWDNVRDYIAKSGSLLEILAMNGFPEEKDRMSKKKIIGDIKNELREYLFHIKKVKLKIEKYRDFYWKNQLNTTHTEKERARNNRKMNKIMDSVVYPAREKIQFCEKYGIELTKEQINKIQKEIDFLDKFFPNRAMVEIVEWDKIMD